MCRPKVFRKERIYWRCGAITWDWPSWRRHRLYHLKFWWRSLWRRKRTV